MRAFPNNSHFRKWTTCVSTGKNQDDKTKIWFESRFGQPGQVFFA